MYVRFRWIYLVSILGLLSLQASALAQVHHKPFPWSPPHKPLIKLIGYVNAQPPKHPAYPPLTLELPGEKQVSFVLTDMQIMAGPLRTPGSILDEVDPYSVNFYLRASRKAVTEIANSQPDEQLTILARYSSGDRTLLVQKVEKSASQEEKKKISRS